MGQDLHCVLHPEAVKALDARAAALLPTFERSPAPRVESTKLTGSPSHVPIAAHLKPGDILEPMRVVTGRNPTTGDVLEVRIHHADLLYRLSGEPASALRSLIRTAALRPELRDVCDNKFIEDSLFRWLEAALPSGSPPGSWVAALIEELSRAVQETTFRVPLVGIAIERGFSLGPYAVRYVSREDVDSLVARIPTEHQQGMRKKYERDYQGKVSVDGRVVGVPSKVRSLAIEAAEKVVLALRFVHPAALDIAARCRIDLSDRGRVPAIHAILTRAQGMSVSAALDETRKAEDFYVSATLLPHLESAGLAALDAFLLSDAPSRLQQAAWVALEIFAHGVGSHLWRERLIGALVAAESLLLVSNTEPIQKSLGQRMAWMLGRSLDERKQLLQDLRHAYDSRSAFVHHGHDVDDSDRESLNRVLAACREVVHVCLRKSRFQTREELVGHLDDLLMT